MKEELKVLIKTSRPISWIILPSIFVAAFTISGAQWSYMATAQLILLSFPYSLYMYGINDIYDFKSDKMNPRKNSVQGIKLNPKYHQLIKKFSAAAVLLLFISSLFTLNPYNIFAVILGTLITYIYSVPPFRIKNRPPFDSIINGVGYVIVPAILGTSFGGTLLDVPAKFYFIALSAAGIHAFTTILDYTVDKKAGDTTFAIAFGKRTAAVFALSTFIITLIFAGIQTTMINYFLIICIMCSAAAAIKPSEKFALKLAKIIYVSFVITTIVYLYGILV